jgi:SWI/SNF-related matrix-associated actin-dependent regulator 1 of chromatin subfamily A
MHPVTTLKLGTLTPAARAAVRGGLQAILFGCGDAAAWESGGSDASSDAAVLDVLESALLRFLAHTAALALAAAAAAAAAATAAEPAVAPSPRLYLTAAAVVRGLSSYGGAPQQRGYLAAAAAGAAASSARLRARLCLPLGGSHVGFSAAMSGKVVQAASRGTLADMARAREERERFLAIAAPFGTAQALAEEEGAAAAAAAAVAAAAAAAVAEAEAVAAGAAAAEQPAPPPPQPQDAEMSAAHAAAR